MSNKPLYVLSVPAGISIEDMHRVWEEVNTGMETAKPIVLPEPCSLKRVDEGALTNQMDRLLMLLALTPEERGFVQTALSGGDQEGFWQVFADYLEEKGVSGAERIRKTAPIPVRDAPQRIGINIQRGLNSRCGIIRITMGVLIDFLHLPEGTRVVAISGDPYFAYGDFAIRVEHSDLPSVEPGNLIPEVIVDYRNEEGKVISKYRV